MKITLTPATCAAIQQVATQISPDMEECTQVELAECVIDADRLSMIGGAAGKAANDEVRKLIKEHGYKAVLRAVSDVL